MPGPQPNPNARRRNNPQQGFTKLTSGRDKAAPPLPGDGWESATLVAWSLWWQSPQATQWDEISDFPSLVVMAGFYDRAVKGNKDAAVEFRQWADRFGLSPLARLRNRWIVAPEAEEEASAAEATVVKLRPAG